MELKEFVSETIISIIEGVSHAQKSAEEKGALVNPAGLMINMSNISNNALWDNSTNVYAQQVSFDVAVLCAEYEGSKSKHFASCP